MPRKLRPDNHPQLSNRHPFFRRLHRLLLNLLQKIMEGSVDPLVGVLEGGVRGGLVVREELDGNLIDAFCCYGDC